MYDGTKYRIYFINDSNVKQYICDKKLRLEDESAIYHSAKIDEAHIFSSSAPSVSMAWIERVAHYVNLEFEYA